MVRGQRGLSSGEIDGGAGHGVGRELRRFFALCARAVEVWCAEALERREERAYLEALQRLEPVGPGSAAEPSRRSAAGGG